MHIENPITKVTQTLQRSDGSEVRIVASLFRSPLENDSTDVFVLRRESPSHKWILCNDKPHPDWRMMSVDDYVKFGRPEKLQTVSQGEILRLVSMLGKPMPVDGSQLEQDLNSGTAQDDLQALCLKYEAWCNDKKLGYVHMDVMASSSYLTASQRVELDELRKQWAELKPSDMTKEHFIELQAEAERLGGDQAKGQDLALQNSRLKFIVELMDASPWTLHLDHGCVLATDVEVLDDLPDQPAG